MIIQRIAEAIAEAGGGGAESINMSPSFGLFTYFQFSIWSPNY